MNNVGLHIIGDAFDPKRLVSPAGIPPSVVKLVDPSLAFKRAVREATGPDCLIIIRFYEPQQTLSTPKANARQWYMNHIAAMLAMTDPNVAFEGYNEIPDADAERYCEFECERLALLQRAGMRSVVGNWSVGTPDLPTWETYRPLLNMLGAGDFVGLHEYWGKAEHLRDAAALVGGWYCGRFKKVPLLQSYRARIIITECGRDAVDGGVAGWKLAGIDASAYIGEIAAYAQAIAPARAVVFTGGDVRGWPTFDVNDIWGRVTAMYTTTTTAMPQPKIRYRLRKFLTHWDRWRVTRPFGYRDAAYSGGVHKGSDMVRADGGTVGAVILAPFDGVVDVSSWRDDRGWYVYLYDPQQRIEFFACHLAEQADLAPGDRVQAGRPIAHVGNTGTLTTGPHLHVGVCEVNDNLDILRWIDPFGDEIDYGGES